MIKKIGANRWFTYMWKKIIKSYHFFFWSNAAQWYDTKIQANRGLDEFKKDSKVI